jgi:uncharacterized protein (TIGR02996 family)
MTHDAFLRSILENPDDDTPRLVYADWLEERDDPRGEFIRVQCRLEKMGGDDPLRSDLEARERDLLARHVEGWVGPLRPWLTGWKFRRGFVERVTVTVPVYLEHADALLRLAPACRVELDLAQAEIPPAVIEFMPESVARENIVLPVGHRNGRLVMAMRDPVDWDTLRKLKFILNRDIEPVAAPAEQIIEAIGRYYGETEVETVDTSCFVDEAIVFDPPWPSAEDNNSPIATMVNLLIQEALGLRATEVHIEPRASDMRVRYRIDDELVERDHPPRRLLAPVVSRIRHMAGMNAGIRGGRQRGRIRGSLRGRPFDLGVSIRAKARGPRVVLTVRS